MSKIIGHICEWVFQFYPFVVKKIKTVICPCCSNKIYFDEKNNLLKTLDKRIKV